MRLHTTTALSQSALAVLALPGCSTGSPSSTDPVASASAAAENAATPTPLSSAALAQRLLEEGDLGVGYTRVQQRPAARDGVTVIDCPALEELRSDAATGASLDFSRKAKASFAHAGGSGSEVSEELRSDTAGKLSRGIGEILSAMASCSTYRVVAGN
ncbi:MAG TPA: hypothetical protein VJT72_00930, partial [Pseudonocardiaceae bacterium]|nr:hypothetical protein [Pseudonocardiaceae bacterium]